MNLEQAQTERDTINALQSYLSELFPEDSLSFVKEDDQYQLYFNTTPLTKFNEDVINSITDIIAYTAARESNISLTLIEIIHKCVFNVKVAKEVLDHGDHTRAMETAMQFSDIVYKELVKSCPELEDDVNVERMSDSDITRQIMEGYRGYQQFETKLAQPKLSIAKIRDVKTPTRGTQGSAGVDFYVPNDYPNSLRRVAPGGRFFIPSGIKANVPDGYALIAFNKSGVALKKGLMVGACVVDSDYQGEIHLHLVNVSNDDVTIEPGDKLTQFLLIPVSHVPVDVVPEDELFTTETDRGTGGFGSTGIR